MDSKEDSKEDLKKDLKKKKRKAFKCLFCDKKFPKKYNWQRHCKTVHEITIATVEKDKPIKCHVCDKRFSKKKVLYDHCRKKHVSLLDHLDVPIKGKRKRSLDGTPKKKIDVVTLANEAVVIDHLPKEYTYKVINFTKIDEDKFNFKVKFYVEELNEVTSFIENYSVKNCIRYRLAKVNGTMTNGTVFNKHYCCHHNAQKKQLKNRKNTNCPASASLIVKSIKQEGGNDKLSCTFRVNHNHNHGFDEAEVKYLLPNSKVAEKFKFMFVTGLPPFKAFKAYKEELQLEYGDRFPEISKNRSICPNQTWVYNYYYKVIKELGIKPVKQEILQFKQETVQYKQENEEEEEETIVEYLEEEFENESGIENENENENENETETDDIENMEIEYLEEEEVEEECDKENELDELQEFLLLHDQKKEIIKLKEEAENNKFILEQFERCLFDIINRVAKNFDFYKDAVKAFNENFRKIKTDAQLKTEALEKIGKIR